MVRNGLRRPGVLLWGVLLLFFAGEVFAEERRGLVLAVLGVCLTCKTTILSHVALRVAG